MFRHMVKNFAATAALMLAAAAGPWGAAQAQAPKSAPAAQKNYKPGEYEMYTACLKDAGAQKWAQALTDLDAWKGKVPASDFANERSVLYIQTYNGLKQFDKVLAEATPMLAKDLDAVFPDPKGGPGQVLAVLMTSAVAIQGLPNPSDEQTATAQKAAQMLNDYNRKPAGLDQAAWDGARKQLQAAAKGALMIIAVRPGTAALAKNPPDCDTAASALAKALGDYPDNAFIAYNLGQAYRCQARKDTTKLDVIYPKAVYEFIRAMVIDPTLGGTQDGPKMTGVLTNLYVNYHGATDGLDELKQQAKASPLPPDNFMIESSAAVALRKQKEFQEKYPQLALWMGIKSSLAGTGGPQYFEEQLKNSQVPKLKGMLVEGKPACRSKELLVSVPEPNQQGTAQTVITLKLDEAMTGKPEAGEIEWEGVPSAFTPDPFMLTMDTEKAKVEGVKTTPCAAPAHKAPAKKAAKKG